MKGVNKVILIGNVGADPAIRQMQSGSCVTLRIATSESFTDKASGEKKELTEWHTVVLFQKLAEIAEKYVKKGSKLYIEGKLKTRSWKDKDGATKYATEIIGKEMQMLDSKSDSSYLEKPNNSKPATKADYNDSPDYDMF